MVIRCQVITTVCKPVKAVKVTYIIHTLTIVSPLKIIITAPGRTMCTFARYWAQVRANVLVKHDRIIRWVYLN